MTLRTLQIVRPRRCCCCFFCRGSTTTAMTTITDDYLVTRHHNQHRSTGSTQGSSSTAPAAVPPPPPPPPPSPQHHHHLTDLETVAKPQEHEVNQGFTRSTWSCRRTSRSELGSCRNMTSLGLDAEHVQPMQNLVLANHAVVRTPDFQ